MKYYPVVVRPIFNFACSREIRKIILSWVCPLDLLVYVFVGMLNKYFWQTAFLIGFNVVCSIQVSVVLISSVYEICFIRLSDINLTTISKTCRCHDWAVWIKIKLVGKKYFFILTSQPLIHMIFASADHCEVLLVVRALKNRCDFWDVKRIGDYQISR